MVWERKRREEVKAMLPSRREDCFDFMAEKKG